MKSTIKQALKGVIKAWDALPGGRRYDPSTIQDWLMEDMMHYTKLFQKKMKSTVAQKIIDYLTNNGPSTQAELRRAIDTEDKKPVSGVLGRLHKALSRTPKRVYICDWVYDDENNKTYPRALYALGSLPDAKKPKTSKTEHNRKYREKNKGQISSVWDLSLHVRDLRAKGINNDRSRTRTE